MTKIQRIKAIVGGFAMILCSLFLLLFPQDGYLVIVALLALSLLAYGIRMLAYYFTMARHMVGGRALLYIGVILFDLGVFSATLADIPQAHIMVYLLILHLITGGLSVARGVEAKRQGAPLWRSSMSYGVANVVLAFACLGAIWAPDVVVYVYAAGLVYAAIVRMASAFRRTAIIYIP